MSFRFANSARCPRASSTRSGSDYFYTADNLAPYWQDSLGLLNLFFSFESADESWYAFASGRNLTSEDYFAQVFLQSSPGYPDTYEIGAGYRFCTVGSSVSQRQSD